MILSSFILHRTIKHVMDCILCLSRRQYGDRNVFLIVFLCLPWYKIYTKFMSSTNQNTFYFRLITNCLQKYVGLSKFINGSASSSHLLIHVDVITINTLAWYLRISVSYGQWPSKSSLSINYSIAEFCWFPSNTVMLKTINVILSYHWVQYEHLLW